MTPSPRRPRIWWIDDDKVAGGPNPTPEELAALREMGFATVISLLDPSEQAPYYDEAALAGLGLARHEIPVPDFHAPAPAQFREFWRAIDEALGRGKVLVHCQGGSGRTGTMGAAYWMRRGLDAEAALARIRRANPIAVESPVQRDSLFALERARGGAPSD